MVLSRGGMGGGPVQSPVQGGRSMIFASWGGGPVQEGGR